VAWRLEGKGLVCHGGIDEGGDLAISVGFVEEVTSELGLPGRRKRTSVSRD
jgi:hypothetical protein